MMPTPGTEPEMRVDNFSKVVNYFRNFRATWYIDFQSIEQALGQLCPKPGRLTGYPP